MSLSRHRMPAAGHRGAVSARAAVDLPNCAISPGTSDRSTPLAEPHRSGAPPKASLLAMPDGYDFLLFGTVDAAAVLADRLPVVAEDWPTGKAG